MQNSPVTPPPTDEQAIGLMKTLWFALLVAQIVLIFVAFKVIPSPTNEPGTINGQIFFGVGIMVLIASFVLPKVLTKSLVDSSQPITVSTLFTPFIFSLALNEACSMMGFMTKKISNNDEISLALFAISGIAYLARFPSESKIKNQLEMLKNQKAK